MTDPSSRLGEIKASSERGSAWWLDPIADARWLLEHVEQLQREHTARGEKWMAALDLRARVADERDDAKAELSKVASRERLLQAQKRAVLDLCESARADYNPADITPWVDVADVVAALGADGDH